jgi:glycosyltransferase involved in cell wall biosynthesis
MRVLQINKFFYQRGGAERVFFDTIAGFRARGETVAEFSMLDSRNEPSQFSEHFIKQLPELKSKMDVTTQWSVFKHLFFSTEVVKKLSALVDEFKPEVAHLHNVYHHLSASSFLTLRKLKVPIVLTVHDVFPLCPNHSLLHGETLAEDLFKNKLYNCIRYKCIDNKFLPSLAGTLEAYYYRFAGIWKHVDRFICPSQFMADKLVEYGFPQNKVRVLKNSYELKYNVLPLGDKIVYLGRTHPEKGIKIFLQALTELREYRAIVAGTGPADIWVNDFLGNNRLNNVERVGWVNGDAWKRVMGEAKVIVVPSIFLENCSVTILEALSYGRLVVATDRGGNPELIINGETGFLCKPEDPKDLACAIRQAMTISENEAKKIIKAGRDLVRNNHSTEKYFTGLETIYKEVSQRGVDKSVAQS